jgi:hypothetical protein
VQQLQADQLAAALMALDHRVEEGGLLLLVDQPPAKPGRLPRQTASRSLGHRGIIANTRSHHGWAMITA